MLGSIVETIVNHLNTRPSGDWGAYKIPDYVTAEASIDPDSWRKNTEKKLYILPILNEYSLENGSRRTKPRMVSIMPNIGVSLLIPFDTFNVNDVAQWDEVEKVLELRLKIDLCIARLEIPKLELQEIQAEPPVEIQLNQRTFLSSTTFIYSIGSC